MDQPSLQSLRHGEQPQVDPRPAPPGPNDPPLSSLVTIQYTVGQHDEDYCKFEIPALEWKTGQTVTGAGPPRRAASMRGILCALAEQFLTLSSCTRIPGAPERSRSCTCGPSTPGHRIPPKPTASISSVNPRGASEQPRRHALRQTVCGRGSTTNPAPITLEDDIQGQNFPTPQSVRQAPALQGFSRRRSGSSLQLLLQGHW